jgi:alcohol dehydrogenase class IV
MDNAKATRIAVAEEHEPSESTKKSPMVPLVYIATQVVDGYEVTSSMNIDGKRIYSESFYPDVVCIDKSMMLPQKNDKSLYFSALDALGHCIEGASMAQVNPFVDAAAFTAIRLIAENLRAMAKNPKDNSAMLGLINGIAVAGTVRSNTMKGMLCLSGSFLAQQTKNHAGLIIGVLLPYFIKDKINRGIPVRDDLLLALKGIDGFCAVPKNEKSDESLKVLLDILSSLNKRIPISLRELNIQQQLLDKAAAYVVESSESNIDRNDCRSFLQLAYENRIGGLQ